MIKDRGIYEYNAERGVFYVWNEKGHCILRVEGVRDVPENHQIDVHLIEPGGEHHHYNCGNRALVKKGGTMDPGTFCATKLQGEGDFRCLLEHCGWVSTLESRPLANATRPRCPKCEGAAEAVPPQLRAEVPVPAEPNQG